MRQWSKRRPRTNSNLFLTIYSDYIAVLYAGRLDEAQKESLKTRNDSAIPATHTTRVVLEKKENLKKRSLSWLALKSSQTNHGADGVGPCAGVAGKKTALKGYSAAAGASNSRFLPISNGSGMQDSTSEAALIGSRSRGRSGLMAAVHTSLPVLKNLRLKQGLWS